MERYQALDDMRLSDQSAGALLGFAAILIVVGLVVISPGGRFAASALAGLFALVPLVFGSNRRRILAGVILGVSVLIGVPAYSEHQEELQRVHQLRQEQERRTPPTRGVRP